ncbi:MAG TPA: hypothetical protein VG146_04505 [Verrucomicrobiae bacterium]|nr:hypothetical protein [Verrucomicrobiae bacterium]
MFSSRKVPMDGGARPLDGTFALSTRFEYFQAKWQTNGLLFRRITSPGDVTNFNVAGELVSWSGHRHALVESGARLTTWDDRDPSVAGRDTSVFYTTSFLLHPLREVLNLGIMYAGIGTVRWEGNRFRAACDVDHEHLLITGELLPVAHGPPRALNVRYAFPHQTNDYMIRYGYESALKHPFLPDVITNVWIVKGHDGGRTEVELDQWRILEMEIANRPLDARPFAADSFTQPKRWLTRVYTNGAIYELGSNGTLKVIYGVPHDGTSSALALRSHAGFYVCWAGLNVAIFALIVRAKERRSEPSKERTNTS